MSSDSSTDINADASQVDISDLKMYGDEELELSKRQVRIITADSPVRLIAGPGAGKTTTIGLRIEYIIRVLGIPPSRILVMAYNREAADQLRADLVEYLGELGRDVTVKTFHGFGRHCLKHEFGHRIRIGTDFEMIPDYYKNRLLLDARDEIIGEMWNQLDCMDPSDKKSALKTFIRKMKSAGMTPNDVANYYGLNGSDGRIFFRAVVQYLDYWIDRLEPDLGTYCWPFVEAGSDPEIVGWKAVTTHLREVLPDLDRPQEATTADLPATDDEDEDRTVVHAVEEVLGQAAVVLGDLLVATKTGSKAEQIQAVAVAAQLLGGAVGNDSEASLPEKFEVRLSAKPFADRLRAAKREIILAMALQPAYEAYQEQLEASGFVDHTDVINETAKAFEDSRGDVVAEKYSHVVVDEFQDSTATQFKIADAVAGDANEITMGGDPCQSVYEWRTAFRENFTARPERVYSDLTTVELKANRRSCSDIRHMVNTLLDYARTDIEPVEQDDPDNIPVARVRPVNQPSTTGGRQQSD